MLLHDGCLKYANRCIANYWLKGEHDDSEPTEKNPDC